MVNPRLLRRDIGRLHADDKKDTARQETVEEVPNPAAHPVHTLLGHHESHSINWNQKVVPWNFTKVHCHYTDLGRKVPPPKLWQHAL